MKPLWKFKGEISLSYKQPHVTQHAKRLEGLVEELYIIRCL